MRIGWFVYGTLDQPTGGYIYDRLVVDGLRARGDDVNVVDPRAASAAVAADGVDVVVGDGLCVEELGPAFEQIEGRAARVLLVHHLGSWEPERAADRALRAWERRALAATDHVVVTGDETAGRLLSSCPDVPLAVVRPGADRLPRARAAAGGAPGAVRLLHLGSLIARKRIHMIFDAVEQLGGGVSLTLIGDARRDPEHARELTSRIERSAVLGECATVRGSLPDGALPGAFAASDALVLASSVEGYGMALVEALHAGLPVIASRAALRAAGLDGCGAALAFDNAGELRDALRRFADHGPLRAAMREAAASAPLPSWEAAVAGFRAVLSRAVSERARGLEEER